MMISTKTLKNKKIEALKNQKILLKKDLESKDNKIKEL